MAQHDYVIANGTGAAVRSDLNNALAAIVSQNSGATAPSPTYAYQWWADTTTGLLKLRNAANSGWITLFQLDGEWSTIALENGTAAAPSIYFKDSGTDTGFYSPGTDQVGISTGGTARLTIDSNGNVNIDSNTLYVDAVNNRVGLGSSTPQNPLVVSNGGANGFEISSATNSGTTSYLLSYNRSTSAYTDMRFDASAFRFETSATERMRLTSTGLGIGTTSPGTNLYVSASGAGGKGGEIIIHNSSARQSGNYAQLGFAPNSDYSNTVICGFIRGLDTGGSAGNPAALTFGVGSAGSPTERMRLDDSGRLLVGTSSSVGGERLQISDGTTANTLGLYNPTSSVAGAGTTINFRTDGGATGRSQASISGQQEAAYASGGRLVFSTTADGASSPTERMRISADGNTRFANCTDVYPNTDNAVRLGANGVRWSAVWAANGTIQTSDERAKKDIADAQLGSEFIKSLRPVSYKWIEGGKRDTGERDEKGNYIYESAPGTRTHWGFIAQEVKQVVDAAGVDFGGWVLTDKDDPDSQQALRYDQFIAPLTKALQEALAKIETLEAKVAALEGA